MIVAEEELKVEEEWVRSEYAEVDIQYIINMHQTNKWTDVLRDVEVRIACAVCSSSSAPSFGL